MTTTAGTLREPKIYCNCMEEVKSRMNLVLGFPNADRTTGSEVTDTEFVCLQIRKILELIALASIAPNKAEYAAQREKFRTDWNARNILRELERINPDFYPTPVEKGTPQSPKVNHRFNPVTDGFLTRSDFEKVYEKCGGVLHATNPFGSKKDLAAIRAQIPTWAQKIQTLLRVHFMHLIGGSKIWLIVMQDPKDGKVHAYPASAT